MSVTYGLNDAIGGTTVTPFPGAPPQTARPAAGAYTRLDFTISSDCSCGANGYQFNEFKVNFMADVHLLKSLPLKILLWAYRGEGDHVSDAMTWGNADGRGIAQGVEDQYKGQTFPSYEECESQTTNALYSILQPAVAAENNTSAKKWDSGGGNPVNAPHHYGGPNQRP